jgi:hypothetical protein
MIPWLPGYEHDPEPGAGLSVGAGRPKAVIHTTESPQGSYNAVRNMWRGPANWGRGLPHFLADGARYVQLLPLNVGAYTLENSPGGADTNRSGPAIQVEICTYAAKGLNDLEIEALAQWLAALVDAGVDLDLSQHPTFYGQDAGFTLATYSARQRMSAGAYQDFNGFCGHQHVPENAHWDPGKLDGLRVERLARQHLGTPPLEGDEIDMASIAELQQEFVNQDTRQRQYLDKRDYELKLFLLDVRDQLGIFVDQRTDQIFDVLVETNAITKAHADEARAKLSPLPDVQVVEPTHESED